MNVSRRPKRKSKPVFARMLCGVMVIIAIVGFVLIYAFLGDRPKSLVQIISLCVVGAFLGLLFVFIDDKPSMKLMVVHIASATIAAIAFGLLWDFALVKFLIIWLVLLLLAVTSQRWLRWM